MPGIRHRSNVARGNTLHSPSEIFIQRKQRVRLNLSVYPPQLLLDAVDVVKKCSPVCLHLPATQPPVGAQQKVKAEDPVFRFRQRVAGHQQKIRHVLLILHSPAVAGVSAPGVLFQPDAAEVLLTRGTQTETVKTGAEN